MSEEIAIARPVVDDIELKDPTPDQVINAGKVFLDCVFIDKFVARQLHLRCPEMSPLTRTRAARIALCCFFGISCDQSDGRLAGDFVPVEDLLTVEKAADEFPLLSSFEPSDTAIGLSQREQETSGLNRCLASCETKVWLHEIDEEGDWDANNVRFELLFKQVGLVSEPVVRSIIESLGDDRRPKAMQALEKLRIKRRNTRRTAARQFGPLSD